MVLINSDWKGWFNVMEQSVRSIPRPLVRTNQWFIVLSVLLTWFTGYVWILALPLLAGLLGLLFDFHPVMRLARFFLKKEPQSYIPEDWKEQRFNQVIAVVCLSLALASFLLGWNLAAYAFSAMVAIAAFVAILGFCVGCYIQFQYKQYKYKRSVKNT